MLTLIVTACPLFLRFPLAEQLLRYVAEICLKISLN